MPEYSVLRGTKVSNICPHEPLPKQGEMCMQLSIIQFDKCDNMVPCKCYGSQMEKVTLHFILTYSIILTRGVRKDLQGK